tara:strand:+ start:528 stop:701 length:174 start_codon:yes stop_codon:yes gene_type:complete
MSLKDNVLDYSQLAQKLDAFLFVSGSIKNSTSSIIVLVVSLIIMQLKNHIHRDNYAF